MATFKQVAKDYAKDHGFLEQEVLEKIHDGKLDGVEDDGILYVIFEIEETPAKSETSNTNEKEYKHDKRKSGVSTLSGIVFSVIGSVVLALFIIMPDAFLGASLAILFPIFSLFLLWAAYSRLNSWATLSGVIFSLIGMIFLVAQNPPAGAIIAIFVGASLILYGFFRRRKNPRRNKGTRPNE